ncbi:LamG-like jellyroll fold domain-containing protein [Sphingobacterium sp. HMA12]|uniref:LamG-like jellyroll fold domain-containing protein n=1 Tax=Sphingobacterium sp. HMA12 TaxID=2050894 RepID=UPI0018F82439|nr:LamG-like jellyroll fold domain-containing protein [Sphingobacterium sp. HMA12]
MKTKQLLGSQILLLLSTFLISCNKTLEIQEKYEATNKSLMLKNATLVAENLDYNTFGFYYNWYGNAEFDNGYFHWGHDILPGPGQTTSPGYIPGTNGDIAANFYPQLGTYSSKDPVTIRKHMEMFVRAGVGVVALSWWNELGTSEPEKIASLLNIANEYGLKVCFHIEPFGGRNAATMKTGMSQLIDNYGNHPAFYRLGGKPVFFIYDSYLTSPSEWATLLSPNGSQTIRNTPYDALVIGLWLEGMNTQPAIILNANFDGFYTYFAADGFTYGATSANWAAMQTWAQQNNKLFIPSVGPGYIDTRIRPWNTATTRNRNNGQYYDNMYQKALDAGTELISITSFNEWHEGSQIEPATPFSSSAFTYLDYGNLSPEYYLDRTAYWVSRFVQKKQQASAELYVNGRNGGYIDFGYSPNYSNFGVEGKQAFTVELWLKMKYTESFGSIISCFNEDSQTQTRKGWVVNNFNNARLRMTLGLKNWGLLEPGFDFSSTEQWVHFAAVVDENGINGEQINGKPVVVKVYQNGILKDQSTSFDGGNYLSNYLQTPMIAFGQPAGVGGMTSNWRLSGYIKDFHLWKSAKSADVIQKIMNKEIDVTGFEPDLVCGWRFNAIPSNNQDIKDLTKQYSAKIVGDHQWTTLN